MPKAFTHLCEKINLSLYDNTLTVYSKPTKSKAPSQKDTKMDLLFLLLFSEMGCESAEVDTIRMVLKNELGVYRFVHRQDSDHHLYHQDNFDMNVMHWHAQFKKTIDEVKLEDILGILEKNSLISAEEHISFMKAYHEANTLPRNLSPLETKSTATLGDKEEAELPFGGFRAGFLSTSVKKDEKPSVLGDEKEAKQSFGGFRAGFLNISVKKDAKPFVLEAKEKQEEPTFGGFRKGFFKASPKFQQETNIVSKEEIENITVGSCNSQKSILL
ncbi:hypothetical protein [Legionella maioricensis]|uniref:hypothetical protein n=1 Tax=Legionella maioricensis TaxID=2896528 RepID=UPI0032B25749